MRNTNKSKKNKKNTNKKWSRTFHQYVDHIDPYPSNNQDDQRLLLQLNDPFKKKSVLWDVDVKNIHKIKKPVVLAQLGQSLFQYAVGISPNKPVLYDVDIMYK